MRKEGLYLEKKSGRNNTGTVNKIFSITGIILCIILGSFLVCNLTLIIKGAVHPEKPPSILGKTPMVVLSGSMSGTAEDHIEAGDLIIIVKADTDKLEKGDVIAFMQEGSNAVVTHRITNIEKDDEGKLLFTTKGDANNAEDLNKVKEENVIGKFKNRIPKVGEFAIFLHEPLGMVLFIAVPLLIFIIYDFIRRQSNSKKEKEKVAELEAEIEKLKAANKKES